MPEHVPESVACGTKAGNHSFFSMHLLLFGRTSDMVIRPSYQVLKDSASGGYMRGTRGFTNAALLIAAIILFSWFGHRVYAFWLGGISSYQSYGTFKMMKLPPPEKPEAR